MVTPYWNDKTKKLSKLLWIPTLDKEFIPYDGLNYTFQTKNQHIDCKVVTSNDAFISTKIKFQELKLKDLTTIIEKTETKNNKNEASTERKQFKAKMDRFINFVNEDQEYLPTAEKFAEHSKKEEEKRIKQLEDKVIREQRYRDNILNCQKVLRSKKVELYPTQEQKDTIRTWMKNCKYVYNYALKHIRENKLRFNFYNVRDLIKPLLPEKIKNETPNNILLDAVKELCNAFKSNVAKIKKGTLKKFKLKYKNNKKLVQTITIEKYLFSENSFCVTYLGDIIKTNDENFKFSDITHDSKLSYDERSNKFYLYVPSYREKIVVADKNKCVSLDPGERTFQTYYGLDHVGSIGNNVKFFLTRKKQQIDCIRKLLRKKVNGKKTTVNRKKRKHLKNVLYRIYRKIRNVTDELHYKTALFLCKNYERILIPDFKTKQMIRNPYKKKKKEPVNVKQLTKEERAIVKTKRKKYQLNKKVKWCLTMMRHYTFRQRLIEKGDEYGCQVETVNEAYTSKTCVKCGHIHQKLGGNKTFVCPNCGIRIGRDNGGSTGIFLRNHELVILPKS